MTGDFGDRQVAARTELPDGPYLGSGPERQGPVGGQAHQRVQGQVAVGGETTAARDDVGADEVAGYRSVLARPGHASTPVFWRGLAPLPLGSPPAVFCIRSDMAAMSTARAVETAR